jgi:2,3-bisphosphoglycerate-dependent phosphoglycerate mutase
MTTIYFVRHCLPDQKWQDDRTRPLTDEGLTDSFKLVEILKDKKIDVFVSSPYKRSFDTIKPTADFYGMTIETDDRLHERKAGKHGNSGHDMFKKRWSDFSFAEEDGESIGSVQKRNIEALTEILKKYDGKTIAIGTHGTALSSIINYYEPFFNAESFLKIIDFMPWVLKMTFDGEKYLGREEVFHIYKEFKG